MKTNYSNQLPIVQLLCFVGFIFIASTLLADGPFGLLAVEKQFEARAFTAADRLDKFRVRLEKEANPRSSEGQQLIAQILLESAYAAHVTLHSIVQKKDEDSRYFHLILNAGKEAGLFDLVYKYSSNGEFNGTHVKELPKNWYLVFTKLKPGYVLVVTQERIVFQFSLTDPFDSQILKLSEVEKAFLEEKKP